MFPNNTFAGARVCAADRAKMLTGAAATQQCFNTSNQIGGLLAADLDGTNLPPAGSPNFLVALNTTTTLAFFKLHVDFGTPANSTFTGPTNITVASFAELCNGGTCVTQPGTTNKLDSLADRAMNRAPYRRFSDHDAMLVTHSVTVGTGGGIRWYELRNMATTPTVFQSGTYAPNAAFRWMGSMTFDQAGNIGLGFSTSSPTISPSIRYTGRLVGDALGTMGQGEATIVAGTGSQTGNLTRWGDYSSMNIDPTDDCTFWFTSEYIGTSGSFNWRTRIGTFCLETGATLGAAMVSSCVRTTFPFPNCGAPPINQPPTVSITLPANGSTVSGTITVSVNASDPDGTVQNVKFDLPDGTSVTDTAAPFSTTFNTTRVANGSATFRATASDNQDAHTTTSVTVTVSNGGG
jgi:hypothetical protein